MRSKEKKICFQMRMEMRWRLNEAEIYKTVPPPPKFHELCYK